MEVMTQEPSIDEGRNKTAMADRTVLAVVMLDAVRVAVDVVRTTNPAEYRIREAITLAWAAREAAYEVVYSDNGGLDPLPKAAQVAVDSMDEVISQMNAVLSGYEAAARRDAARRAAATRARRRARAATAAN